MTRAAFEAQCVATAKLRTEVRETLAKCRNTRYVCMLWRALGWRRPPRTAGR